ncbi:MAG: ABC transporter permease [Thermoproteota archaeon]
MKRHTAFSIWASLPDSQLLNIVWREFLDALRDRRTMVATIILPIILVPLSLNIPMFLISPKRNPPSLGILQLDQEASNFTSMLMGIGDLRVTELSPGQNLTDLVSKNVFDLVLVIPANFSQLILSGGQADLLVIYDASNTRSTIGLAIIEAARSHYSDMIVEKRLRELKIDPSIISPVGLKSLNIREVTGAQAFAGMMVPYFIGLVSVLAGGSFATDTTAGEKERKTLEAFLTMPVTRVRIVIGKFIGVFVLSIISVVFDLIGMAIGISIYMSLFSEITMEPSSAQLTIETLNFLIIALFALIVSVTGDAILMVVCIYAKSFKEAQQYTSFILSAFTIPMMGIMFFPPSMLENLVLLPIYGPIMIMRNAVFNVSAPGQLLLCLASSLIYIAVLLILAIRLFSSEKVLFRV